MGLTVDDLDGLEYGMIIDMMTESENDGAKYNYIATQEDIDRW